MNSIRKGYGFEEVTKEKGSVGHLQDEVHNCCFPEFWSFVCWKTPRTQNTALDMKKNVN